MKKVLKKKELVWPSHMRKRCLLSEWLNAKCDKVNSQRFLWGCGWSGVWLLRPLKK